MWFSLNLGDAMLADDSLDRITALFSSEFQAADRPIDMAVFVRHESENHLHCEVKVYFSPAAAKVALAVAAQPCRKPATDSLDLLSGLAASWAVLFPVDGH